MNRSTNIRTWARLTMLPLLAAGLVLPAAQAQDRDHDRQDQRDNEHNNQHNDQHNDRGNDHRNDRGSQNSGRGSDFHFQDQDRGRFASHYQSDVRRWQSHPQGRPQFARGQRIPPSYRLRAVPRSYYAGAPLPPPGYQYGYYDGYVVAYDPTTRVIGDVLDLVGAAINR